MNLRETKRKVTKLIYNGVNNGWSDKKITKEVGILLKKADIKQSVVDEIEKEARSRTEFMKKHAASNTMRAKKTEILNKSGSLAQVFGKKLPEQGVNELIKGLKQGKRSEDLVKLVSRRINVAEHHARTIAKSSKKALNRVATIENAKLAGIDMFVLSGHSSEREYFAKYKGKPMTEAEIMKTKNDVGWNPLHYCCGPNCQHTYKPYIDEIKVDNKEIDLSVKMLESGEVQVKANEGSFQFDPGDKNFSGSAKKRAALSVAANGHQLVVDKSKSMHNGFNARYGNKQWTCRAYTDASGLKGNIYNAMTANVQNVSLYYREGLEIAKADKYVGRYRKKAAINSMHLTWLQEGNLKEKFYSFK
jgi:Phage minor capsid protein 2